MHSHCKLSDRYSCWSGMHQYDRNTTAAWNIQNFVGNRILKLHTLFLIVVPPTSSNQSGGLQLLIWLRYSFEGGLTCLCLPLKLSLGLNSASLKPLVIYTRLISPAFRDLRVLVYIYY